MRLSRTLSFYIARHFLFWLAAFFLGMATIVLTVDMIELLRRASSRPDASFWMVGQLAILKLPQTAQEFLPFAVLFGCVMAFWRLTRTSELVVARSLGVSVWQFMLPAIAVALAVGLFKVALFNQFAAITFARYEVLEARIFRGGVQQMSVSPSGLWLRQSTAEGSAILHAQSVSRDLRILQRVMVLRYDRSNAFVARLDAGTAELMDGYWQLRGTFEALNGQPSRRIGPMQLPTDFTPEKIQDSFARPETMSFWALPGFIDMLERAGFSAVRHRLYWQEQLALPILLCAMVLIAATVSLRPQRRGGVGQTVAIGIAAGFLLYFLSDVVYALGLSARIPVPLAAWAPAAVSTFLGLALLLHQEDG